MRRRLLHAVIATVLVMLVGCDNADKPLASRPSEGSKPGSMLVHDGFISTSKRETDAFFPDASMQGRLRFKNGCLLVGDWVAVFTADFAWDQETKTLTWPQGSAKPGDQVEFGGGAEPPGAEKTEPLLSPTARQEIERCIAATGAVSYSFMTNA